MLRWKVSVFLLSLLVANSSAFTVAPPPPEMVLLPSTTTNLILSSQQLPAMATTTSLPSAKDLLALSSTSNMLSAATTVTAAPVASTKTASTTAAPMPAGAAGILVTNVQYDGRVPKTEADEYVTISNTSKAPMDVSGYYLYVATSGTQGATFTFPKQSVVPPGQSVRVYTNEIHKETGGYSFGSGKALWNNKGGLAVLRDAKGNKVCEFKYQGTSATS
jgi:hypothetical protein